MDDGFFTDFYAEMRPRVARFIRARFPFDLAEDLASETMTTLWRKSPPTPVDETGRRQLRSLTYSIARGHIRNAERKMMTEAKIAASLTEARLRITGTVEDPTYEAVVPSRLAEAMTGLSQDDRQALNLFLVGFRTGEIADILQVTPKAASMRLRRAKDRLRKLAEEEVSDDA